MTEQQGEGNVSDGGSAGLVTNNNVLVRLGGEREDFCGSQIWALGGVCK